MIQVNTPLLHQSDIEFAQRCLESGWISSSGEYIELFEDAWANFCEMEHGIAVSNGTVALELAVRCLDLDPGDEVILPSFTIISCAQAILRNGGIPVLVDCDPETWCMDVNLLESKITERTRAIMPVHIYGHPVDMDPLQSIADQYSLMIIEDAAEAHGGEYLVQNKSINSVWKRCGGFGHISTFSFYANKPITTGEGGMLLTRDAGMANRMRQLRNLSFTSERRFSHAELGYNFRMTNIQAALGYGQTIRINQIIAQKRRIGQVYLEGLQGVAGISLPVEKPWARNIYWMFGVVLEDDNDMTAIEFAKELSEHGIQTRPFFVGMHDQPALRDLGLFEGEHYPIADRLARQGLYLPSGLALKDDEQAQVIQAVIEILG